MAPQTDLQLSYTDKEINSFTDNLVDLNVDAFSYLVLMVGKYQKGKEQLLKQVASKTGSEIVTVDLDLVITSREEESFQNIDQMFAQLADGPKYIYFANGDRLGGVYTGYSYSVERYSTPQERYFLNKMNACEKIAFLDLKDRFNANPTLRRLSQAVISFDQPKSFLNKMFWKLKQIRVNGSNFESTKKAAV